MDNDMADIFDIRQKIQTPTLRCSLKTIAFEYLWLLFNPGDVVLSSPSKLGSEFVQMFTVMPSAVVVRYFQREQERATNRRRI